MTIHYRHQIDNAAKVLLKEQFPAAISLLSRATCEFMKLVVSASGRTEEKPYDSKGFEELEMTQYVEPVMKRNKKPPKTDTGGKDSGSNEAEDDCNEAIGWR